MELFTNSINIEIAKWAGWTEVYAPGLPGLIIGKKPKKLYGKICNCEIEPIGEWYELPDYCSDLNALSQIERMLNHDQKIRFIDELCNIIQKDCNPLAVGPFSTMVEAFFSSPAQRADSLLKVISE